MGELTGLLGGYARGNMERENPIVREIIKLWNEAHNVKYIAQKLGLIDELGELDTELVEMVVENPANYRRRACT